MEHQDQYQQFPEPKYECLLFDVDDTLYPLHSGLSDACTDNIIEYMINKLGIEPDKVPELNRQLYKDYGTSMAGLRAIGYDFDYEDYHRYVHGRLPYGNLKPDPVLRALLQSLPVRKVIFSNANKEHIDTVLQRLGLEDCFERVIDFETLNPINRSSIRDGNEDDAARSRGSKPSIDLDTDVNTKLPKTPVVCKPFEDAFEQALKIANINPKKTWFFDDSIRNIQMGKQVGLHTVWVGSSHRREGVDCALESIHNIREAFPELWEAVEKKDNVGYSGKVAIETTVRA